MNCKVIFIIIFFTSKSFLFAFPPAADLERQLDTAKGKNRVNILNELAELYELNSYKASIHYSGLALIESSRINYPEGMAFALSRMIIPIKNYLPYEFSSNMLYTLELIYKNTEYPGIKIELAAGLGSYYSAQNDIDKASVYFLDAISLYESYNPKNISANPYIYIAWFYRYIYDYENCAESYLKVIKQIKPESMPLIMKCKILYGIEAMFDAGLDSYANYYLNKMLSENERKREPLIYGLILRIKGKFFLRNNNIDKGIDCFKKAAFIFHENQLYQYLSDIQTLIAHCYQQKGNHIESLKYNKLALEYRKLLGPLRNIASSLINLSIDFYNLGMYDESEKNLLVASDLAKNLNLYHYFIRANEYLFKVYEKTNKINLYKFDYDLFTEYQRITKNIENSKTILKYQLKYEMEKKDRDFVKLLLNKEEIINSYTFIIIILILIIVIFLFIRNYQKNKHNKILISQNIKLEEANKKISENEKALININSDLDKIVKERTKHLNAEIQQRIMAEINLTQLKDKIESAYEKEKDLNAIKSRFISMISHEFRTPLTVITSSADIISLVGEKDKSEKIFSQSNKIKKSVKQMLTLINEILVFNSSETADYVLNNEPIDVKELVNELVSEQKTSYKSDVNVKINFDCDPCIIKSDKKYLRHILSNLIGNAVKYTNVPKKIYITIIKKKTLIQFLIRDEGIGIPSCDMEKIWDPFFRGNNTKLISGTGFGLSIVKDFTTKLGGEIEINSKINEGTSVSLIIPINKQN